MKALRDSSTQRAHGEAWCAEASLGQADGLHFTVERKPLKDPHARWERVECSWEMPEPLTAHWQADAVARTLALRFDGEQACRVLDPSGKVLAVYVLQKSLLLYEGGQARAKRKKIPVGFEVPRVADVLAEKSRRRRPGRKEKT